MKIMSVFDEDLNKLISINYKNKISPKYLVDMIKKLKNIYLEYHDLPEILQNIAEYNKRRLKVMLEILICLGEDDFPGKIDLSSIIDDGYNHNLVYMYDEIVDFFASWANYLLQNGEESRIIGIIYSYGIFYNIGLIQDISLLNDYRQELKQQLSIINPQKMMKFLSDLLQEAHNPRLDDFWVPTHYVLNIGKKWIYSEHVAYIIELLLELEIFDLSVAQLKMIRNHRFKLIMYNIRDCKDTYMYMMPFSPQAAPDLIGRVNDAIIIWLYLRICEIQNINQKYKDALYNLKISGFDFKKLYSQDFINKIYDIKFYENYCFNDILNFLNFTER